MAEEDVGIPGGTERPFRHGGLQPKKKRAVFWKRKLIPFGNS
jgi:hypothetical protein